MEWDFITVNGNFAHRTTRDDTSYPDFYQWEDIEKFIADRLTFKGAIEAIRKLDNCLEKTAMHSQIKNVIFNNPATIVFWSDGTKTVVKCENEKFDREKGLAMAITKKLLGNNQGYYYDVFKKWLPKKENMTLADSARQASLAMNRLSNALANASVVEGDGEKFDPIKDAMERELKESILKTIC